jgi:hypothetical protein
LIDYLLFYVPLKNVSLTWRLHVYRHFKGDTIILHIHFIHRYSVADPGISKREGAVVARGSEGYLKVLQWVKGKAVLGVQGAKPPEADEFLHVKGVFSLN